MKNNSTFGILKRTGLVMGIIVAVIILSRVGFALTTMWRESNSYWADEVQPSFWDYFIRYTDDPGVIAFSLLGGAILTGLCALVVGLIWIVGRFILHGLESEDETPDCTNQNCACVSHRAEVFADSTWDLQECKDPNCTCVHYHHDETFDKKTESWT